MGKNVRLADIYIKIYNKRRLTLEDLTFLAKYDRECFEKTCQNLLYNLPEAKELLKPECEEQTEQEVQQPRSFGEHVKSESNTKEPKQEQGILTLLENLKKMEWEEFPMPELDTDKVKHLLGSLYMELLFPHNDKYRYFQLDEEAESSIFNQKA